MKDIVIDTYLAAKDHLNPNNRKSCFELFGYDFLIDEDFRIWLIEINTNPYLGIPNEFIADLLPKMLNEMLMIVLDPVYKPASNQRSEDHVDNFELVYCEEQGINQR